MYHERHSVEFMAMIVPSNIWSKPYSYGYAGFPSPCKVRVPHTHSAITGNAGKKAPWPLATALLD